MAILSEISRHDTWAIWMRESASEETISITKSDLRDAVNAIDQWIDDNAVSFNSSIPQPARSSLSAKQKARLLMYVVRRRFEIEI